MVAIRTEITAGNQFTGVDKTTGLFMPDKIGLQNIQLRINSVVFHSQGGTPAFTLTLVDPVNALNEPLIVAGTSDDLVQSLSLLLINEGPVSRGEAGSWGLRFVTTGMTGAGTLVVDYDPVTTET